MFISVNRAHRLDQRLRLNQKILAPSTALSARSIRSVGWIKLPRVLAHVSACGFWDTHAGAWDRRVPHAQSFGDARGCVRGLFGFNFMSTNLSRKEESRGMLKIQLRATLDIDNMQDLLHSSQKLLRYSNLTFIPIVMLKNRITNYWVKTHVTLHYLDHPHTYKIQ